MSGERADQQAREPVSDRVLEPRASRPAHVVGEPVDGGAVREEASGSPRGLWAFGRGEHARFVSAAPASGLDP